MNVVVIALHDEPSRWSESLLLGMTSDLAGEAHHAERDGYFGRVGGRVFHIDGLIDGAISDYLRCVS